MHFKIGLFVPFVEFIIYYAVVYRIALDSQNAGLGAIGLIFQIPILMICFSSIGTFITMLLIGQKIKFKILCSLLIFIISLPILYVITLVAFGIADRGSSMQGLSKSFMINVDQTNARIELSK
jgi:hypothetical protein